MNVVKVMNDQQLKDAYSIRTKVFVEEQNVPKEEEVDDLEDQSIHFVMYENDRTIGSEDIYSKPIGAGRLRLVDGYAKAERICVAKDARGTGAGRFLMNEMEKEALNLGVSKVKLNAQTHAEPFYSKLGYEITSDEFLDAGIPHVSMVKTL
ncbi:GNAT family N-acetyltransferase [Alkalihalophilus pseudofirmus]|uniref:GNAT family N-acetyltransferase n=1 Tax=Alkalihalophilus pseudofirmus TaxID=79885 RepID=UPI0009524EB9|nr:GNAT family N-acetyltransferase [Alkalihalophilus pseudofirmus]OLS34112.1 GNAT family N-acetyltransferase [Alkalihalophilus pseudofirmus]WEG18084.1 GNAT family N-acetyltransferase [Alkalihalophilus pseudofirmus]